MLFAVAWQTAVIAVANKCGAIAVGPFSTTRAFTAFRAFATFRAFSTAFSSKCVESFRGVAVSCPVAGRGVALDLRVEPCCVGGALRTGRSCGALRIQLLQTFFCA